MGFDFPEDVMKFLRNCPTTRITRKDEKTFNRPTMSPLWPTMPLSVYRSLEDCINQNKHWVDVPVMTSDGTKGDFYSIRHDFEVKTIGNVFSIDIFGWNPPSVSDEIDELSLVGVYDDFTKIKREMTNNLVYQFKLAGLDANRGRATLEEFKDIHHVTKNLLSFMGYFGFVIHGVPYVICGRCFTGVKSYVFAGQDVNPHYVACVHKFQTQFTSNVKCMPSMDNEIKKNPVWERINSRYSPDHDGIDDLSVANYGQENAGVVESICAYADKMSYTWAAFMPILKNYLQRQYKTGPIRVFLEARAKMLSMSLAPYGKHDFTKLPDRSAALALGSYSYPEGKGPYPGYETCDLDEADDAVSLGFEPFF